MDCTEFLHRYSDYDDSLLPPAELSEVRAHLAACASCARYDRVLRKGRMVARQLPGVEPRPDFEGRLRQRLRGAGRPGAGRWRGARDAVPGGAAVLPGLAAAAMAAVTILVVATSALALLDRLEGAGPWGGERRATDAVVLAAGGSARTAPPAMVVPVALEGRSVVLPAAGPRIPRAWAAERVDRRLASSYSPLVTGPPAYRAVRAYPMGPTNPLRRTLD